MVVFPGRAGAAGGGTPGRPGETFATLERMRRCALRPVTTAGAREGGGDPVVTGRKTDLQRSGYGAAKKIFLVTLR